MLGDPGDANGDLKCAGEKAEHTSSSYTGVDREWGCGERGEKGAGEARGWWMIYSQSQLRTLLSTGAGWLWHWRAQYY